MKTGANSQPTTTQHKRKFQQEAKSPVGIAKKQDISTNVMFEATDLKASTCAIVSPTPLTPLQVEAKLKASMENLSKQHHDQRSLLRDSSDLPIPRGNTPVSVATYSSGHQSGDQSSSWLSTATYDSLCHLFTMHQNAGRKFMNGIQKQADTTPISLSQPDMSTSSTMKI